MDIWKYFDVTHRNHVICNPASLQNLDRLIELCDLQDGDRVLEFACGKSEFLIRLAERSRIQGTGIDISPFCVSDARERIAQRVPDADLNLLQMNGSDYKEETPHQNDLVVSIGADWIFGGHKQNLQALMGFVRQGGLILVGQPFWLAEPDPEYLSFAGCTKDSFGTHFQNIEQAEELGLTPLFSVTSSREDWDRYETLQWMAFDDYARANPEDPDLPELGRRVSHYREEYLRWGSEFVGWALYLFRA